ncbi:MAG TPA: FliM/FliN family flagellar motor C-terminal domain-containing protein [Candidatus Acidoferrales bacterium]|jgi:flagellar motor switch/type III secretory pathway protein FliN|nr:FliM/FliN family flagellar motor C-terminal domain-containing protein [Candidatus Acidoferrales bacterium]
MSATTAATAATVAAPAVATAQGPAPAAAPAKVEGAIRWADAELLPCQLSAEVDIARFTVRDLFCLDVDSVLDTGWTQSTDVPLKANSHLIGWVEFEVIGERLAVRLTELY